MTQLGLFAQKPSRREPPSFHARAHVSPSEALAGQGRARKQEDGLLAWWRMQDAAVPGVRFSPSQVWIKFFEKRIPLTSARRAITNLCDRCELTHWESDRVEGLYGSKESRWSLAEPHAIHGGRR